MKQQSMEKLRRRAELERKEHAEFKERKKLAGEAKSFRRERKYGDILEGARQVRAGMKPVYKSLKGIQAYAKRRLKEEDKREFQRFKQKYEPMHRKKKQQNLYYRGKHGKFVTLLS